MTLARTHAARIRRRRAGVATATATLAVAVFAATALALGANPAANTVRTLPADGSGHIDGLEEAPPPAEGALPGAGHVSASDDGTDDPPPGVATVTGVVGPMIDSQLPPPPPPRRAESSAAIEDLVEDAAGDVGYEATVAVDGRGPRERVPVDDPAADLLRGGAAFADGVLTLRSTLDDLSGVGTSAGGAYRWYTAEASIERSTVVFSSRETRDGIVSDVSVRRHDETSDAGRPRTSVSATVDAVSGTITWSASLDTLNRLLAEASAKDGRPSPTLRKRSELGLLFTTTRFEKRAGEYATNSGWDHASRHGLVYVL